MKRVLILLAAVIASVAAYSSVVNGSGAIWGDITGVLTNQSDLVAALNTKISAINATLTNPTIINGTLTGTTDIINGTLSGTTTTSGAFRVGSTTWQWPSTDGIAGQALTTNGSGALSFATVAPVSVLLCGADPTGVSDSRAAIQSCINLASSAGAALYVPSGTYILTKGPAQTDEAGTTYPALTMTSNMWIQADYGATFKLANNQSTSGTPINTAMFFTNSVLSNVRFSRLTIDMNGANNVISPSAPSSYNHFTFAHIMVSGTPGGVAAQMNNVLIEDCTFLNTPGTTSIGMAQTNTAFSGMGSGWRLTNNYFYNNGTNTDDHSSVYGWANDVILEGNVFDEPTMAATTGGKAAFEMHGARTIFTHNQVRNYYIGMYAADNSNSAVQDSVISNNIFGPVGTFGVYFYRETSASLPVQRIQVIGNDFLLGNDATSDATKIAIYLGTVYTANDILISSNRATSTSTTYASVFCEISSQTTSGQKTTGIVVRDNQANGFTYGVFVNTGNSSSVPLGSIAIEGNTFYNLTPAGIFSLSIGIAVGATSTSYINQLSIANNTVYDDQGSPTTQYGIYLGGYIGTLTVGPLTTWGLTISPYTESGLTVTTRSPFTVDGSVSVTQTFTAASVVVTGLTNSQAVFTNGADKLVSNAITGTGNVVMSTSPTLVTPALGTPSALVGTNITGTASGLTAGTVTTNANLTGPITSSGNATSIAAQTGTGSTFAMQASPAFTGTVTAAAITTSQNISASDSSGLFAKFLGNNHGFTISTSGAGSNQAITALASNSCGLMLVADGNGNEGVFFLSYSNSVVIISQNGTGYATSNTGGKTGITLVSSTGVVTFNNQTGSSNNYTVTLYAL